MQLEDDIINIKNIGSQRAAKFHRLGIYKILDLIEYFPRNYNDRTNISKIGNLDLDKENTFIARVSDLAENVCVNQRIITKLKLKDSTGSINAIWYNQPYLKNSFSIGDEYIFTGKVKRKYNNTEVESPEYEKIGTEQLLSGGRIVPIYSATDKLSQKIIRQTVKSALDGVKNQLKEFMPYSIIKKYKLMDRADAIENIHFPQSENNFFSARYRLAFEELFLLQLGLMRIKQFNSCQKVGAIIKRIETGVEQKLPFELTSAQKNALNEIFKSMSDGNIMGRLIQGDVGSGKTIVAIITALNVVKNGYQVAMMAPTEVLAKQHFESFNSILSEFGIKVVLLTGSITKKNKTHILEQIESGEADIILGTHAIIQSNVVFKNLALVITDEQHRFGVNQRTKLSDKGKNPHTLVMTATPIPRTLALILYGDLDITTIDELPPERQNIDTFAVNTSYHSRIYKFIQKQIQSGRQIYIICPIVDESENLKDLKSVTEYTQKLKEDIFSNYKVEYIYGKMKADCKQSIMDRFLNGDIDILVSTTVIEVGINVPNAAVMLVENADRFGLAQLHQLRGRVGRGKHKSYCILVSDSKSKLAAERMQVMHRSNDGFEISEVDLNLRGPGDFFGTRQHGLPELKIANLYRDMDILKSAQMAASEILNDDFELKKDENTSLKYRIDLFFKNANLSCSL